LEVQFGKVGFLKRPGHRVYKKRHLAGPSGQAQKTFTAERAKDVEGAKDVNKVSLHHKQTGGIMKKLVLALLLTVVFAVPAFSQMMDTPMRGHGGGQGQMMHMGDMMGMCIEQAGSMGLTDDQIIKMKSLHREMQRKQARFKADLKIAQIDLMEIMEVKDFDMDKAASAVRRITEIRTAQQMAMLKAVREMRTMLTEDQFKKMKMMMFTKMGEKRQSERMMKKH
jgi:Spy/CpxP family protein refolding chaperone